MGFVFPATLILKIEAGIFAPVISTSYLFFILFNINLKILRGLHMKLKSTSIFAGILALALVAAPLTAQACGDKEKNSESNLPEGTESSLTVEDSRFSA